MHQRTFQRKRARVDRGKYQRDFRTADEQISTLTQLLSPLIQENSARNSPKADVRSQQIHSRHSPSLQVGTFRTFPAEEIRNTGFSREKKTFTKKSMQLEKSESSRYIPRFTKYTMHISKLYVQSKFSHPDVSFTLRISLVEPESAL